MKIGRAPNDPTAAPPTAFLTLLFTAFILNVAPEGTYASGRAPRRARFSRGARRFRCSSQFKN